MAKRFSVEAVFKAVDRITKPVSRIQNRVKKMTRSMDRGFRKLDRTMGKVAGGLKKMVAGAAVGVAMLSTALIGSAVAGAAFEQAITNVGAVSLRTRDQIVPLEQLALKLGKTTKFTATQSANAMEILARAGFTTNQILQATPAILSAAAASGLEIAEVADHVSNVLKGMGLEMTQSARVADVLALASSKTNSSIGTLGESMRNVAATARQLNIPLEDTVAAVALLQDVGLDASVAGSALNTMLTKMAAPSKKITNQMKKFGISFKDSKGDMLAFGKVIEQLNIASKKAGGNFDQVAFLAELVGLRGQKAAANLSRLFETGKLEELTKQLAKAKGAADEMARIRMDTVQGSFLLLVSAIDGVNTKLFNMNSGPLKATIDRMTEWIGINEEMITSEIGGFIESLVDNFSDVVKWIKRIGIGLVVFVALSAILKTFIGIMTAVNLVMTANPVGLIVVGVGALIAALILLMTNLEEVGVIARNVWDGIVSVFSKGVDEIKNILKPVGDLIDDTILAGLRGLESIGFSINADERAAELGIQIPKPPEVTNFQDLVASHGRAKPSEVEEPTEKPDKLPEIVSPQDRLADRIEERSTSSSAEVTIRDTTGRAELSKGDLGPNIKLQRTGAFQ